MVQKINYAELCKRIINQLSTLIINPELPSGRLPEDFKLLMESTEDVHDLCKNEQVYFTEKFEELLSKAAHLKIEIGNINLEIIQLNTDLEGDQTLLILDTVRLVNISVRIATIRAKIAFYEEEAKWKWYYIFFPVLGLIAWGIRAKINMGFKEIEVLQLQVENLTQNRTAAQVEKDKALIANLLLEIKKDKKAMQDLTIQLDKAEAEKLVYAIKTSTAQSMKGKIAELEIPINGLVNNTDDGDVINFYLNKEFEFESLDGSKKKMLVKEAILKWGGILEQRLNANGKNIHAVHIEVETSKNVSPTDIGHLYQIREKEWVLGSHYRNGSTLPVWASVFDQSFFEYTQDEWSTYAYNKDKSLHLTINLWLRKATVLNKLTGEKVIANIMDASTAAEVKAYEENGLTLVEMNKMCLMRNWRPASAFEVSNAWMHKNLNKEMFGRILDGRFAVPVQSDSTNFKRGVNIVDGGGNQGFFYIDNHDK